MSADEPGSNPPSARVLRLDQVERVPLDDGDWLSLRRPLAVTAFGINAYTARDADSPLIERHDERSSGAGAHQEVYLVQQGHAVFTVDDEEVDAPAGTLVAIDPGSTREARNAAPNTVVVVIGGKPGAAMPPSPFEYWYAAIPAHEAGDHTAAAQTIAEGFEHYPDHGLIHYTYACELALLGRREAALEHLATAFSKDPRIRGWAEDDTDLDSIRDSPDYPG